MRTLVDWAVRNAPGMNTLMVALLILGGASLYSMRREEFPEFELEMVLVTVPYPGASPEEVEEGICLKIEEAVRGLNGIKKQTSIAAEGMGSLVLEIEANVPDVQKVLNEVRSEVDRIPSFPELAEDPEIKQVTMRRPAIRVAVIGPDSDDPEAELKLREVTEEVRNGLLMLPNVTQTTLIGTRDYQIDVEISESRLREHGLTLRQVAQILRRENLEMPGGLLKSQSDHILLRGRHKRVTGEEIAKIPIVTRTDGVVVTVGDLGVVLDEFADTVAISRVDHQPAIVLSVDKTASEDLLTIVQQVHGFVDTYEMPPGYKLKPWRDASIAVEDRMNLLSRNGIQGLILVFIMLAIFLEIRLAFWVAMGIPISILGACAILLYFDQTLNMLSMFAFLMALGIVVDDAIVVGENIYAHRQKGRPFHLAAVEGTLEVFPSVFASVMTSIIAFAPLLFVSGIMGKFIAVLPVTVIAMLAISLFESIFILPAHLAHADSLLFRVGKVLLYPLMPIVWFFTYVNQQSAKGLDWFIDRVYLPVLRFALHFPTVIASLGLMVLLLSVGYVQSGMLPFVVFPRLDSNNIQAKINFQDGTPSAVTNAATKRLEQTIREVAGKHKTRDGRPVVKTIHRTVGTIEASNRAGSQPSGGSNTGLIALELVDTGERGVRSRTLLAEWRKAAGEFPGAESVIFESPRGGPGGKAVEFKLLSDGDHVAELEAAIEETKERLAEYPGIYDVVDDSTPGKYEFRIRIHENAIAMGITLAELSETIRASYYGDEVMRLQRGRHEVKLMVRYPDEERKTLASFDEIRVRTADGKEYPISELADVTVTRGDSEINRVDQMRSITITADLNEAIPGANAKESVEDLQKNFMPGLFEKYPNIRVRWEGQAEQTRESVGSMIRGLVIALLAMYVLLTMQFSSYLQPLLIMMIIPFGAIGAIIGHALLGLSITMFSLFGLVALTGVVVNDSIVLIDFINDRLKSGMPLSDALIDAGRRRFRPVLLTSVTTVAGLTPILLETSMQAQFLIPMATSLCFGIMMSTVLVLVLVPSFYQVLGKLTGTGQANAGDDLLLTEERLEVPVPHQSA
jgi:hydrophobic/amphiphilic exporter-1 (mainly G- bacteria), HAE1 family